MSLEQTVINYIERHRDEAFRLLVELAKIPSPSNHEEKRAEFCKTWLDTHGAKGVSVDEALNVVYPVNCGENNQMVVFMAHSDIVFPDTEELPLYIGNGRIRCPGVGDDTANVAALLMAAKYVTEMRLKPKNGGVLFVVNSGEEGLGNLKGSRKIIQDFGSRIAAFVSFDGCNGRITNRAVGSKRYRVEVTTEGGHSYLNFGNANAIAYLASMINTLYMVETPEEGKTTYNAGTISGGTSVNTIAQQAEMLYEFRSDSRDSLAVMEKHFNAAIDLYRAKGIGVNVELAGERPCMGDVDPEKQRALEDKAAAAVQAYFEMKAEFESGSTDCNIPFSAGIPSVSVGCYTGGGQHTREEYLEINSLFPGLLLAFDLILDCFAL
jgi:acetylornithine deacetylase/succinyl-diaminopimelate desuccinylase-like protein